ncbi:MAG: hypothetical protein CM15mP49_22930 [Actinomycetota bacterium]|nr:MAG: hypothetical protein CM15mP49_22930 [Actinomycetota bacterium]
MYDSFGPATYGRFMNVRVFDFWVHQRDMTMPLGIETDDSGAHARLLWMRFMVLLGTLLGKNWFRRWDEYCFPP